MHLCNQFREMIENLVDEVAKEESDISSAYNEAKEEDTFLRNMTGSTT